VKLADFGLAKAASQLETTDPGVVKGKMSYLSPEAARGEEVDQRADIFAAGILLYEMLTGKRLFYGDSDYQTVELVRAAKIPPIAPQNPEVEPEIEEICRKALAKRMEDRFQTATDLQDALAHYLFSRGLKMIQRDIGDLVRGCLDDIATLSGAKRPKPNIIDTLLHEEIHSFTSLEFDDPNAPPDQQQRPAEPPSTGEFVDPRAWADDPDWSARRAPTRRPTNHTRRPTPPPPLPNQPPPRPAARTGSHAVAPDPLLAVGGPHPTPSPDQLADALEPMARRPPAPALPQQQKLLPKGILIGVVLGAAAIGALFAALLARH
jgi:serine/threonine protein kinase